MKLRSGVHSRNKYLITTTLVCVVITTFLVTRNNELFVYLQPPSQQIVEPHENISVKLSPEIQSKIETLALFIGYGRSGHTLIGALLDAHPHIVIANELNIFERWTEWKEENKTKENVMNKIYENSYRQAQGVGYRSPTKRGRTYAVPNQWQGKYKDYIKVIGDKKGGKTTKFFNNYKEVTNEVLDEIDLPVKFIHMVRNPYDNIATMILRSMKIPTHVAMAFTKQINDALHMEYNIRVYESAVYNNLNLLQRFGSSVLTLHSEDVIANPKKPLKKLCEFLNVTCSEDYLNDCASIIYKNASRTRSAVVWSYINKQKVEQLIANIPFLRRYTFKS